MTCEEKYEKFKEACNRTGHRVYEKPDQYNEVRGMSPHMAIAKSLMDCKPLLFIIHMEVYSKRDIDDIEGCDIFVVPYRGLR